MKPTYKKVYGAKKKGQPASLGKKGAPMKLLGFLIKIERPDYSNN